MFIVSGGRVEEIEDQEIRAVLNERNGCYVFDVWRCKFEYLVDYVGGLCGNEKKFIVGEWSEGLFAPLSMHECENEALSAIDDLCDCFDFQDYCEEQMFDTYHLAEESLEDD